MTEIVFNKSYIARQRAMLEKYRGRGDARIDKFLAALDEIERLRGDAEKWQSFAHRLIEWLNYEARVGALKLSREAEQVRKLTGEYAALKGGE